MDSRSHHRCRWWAEQGRLTFIKPDDRGELDAASVEWLNRHGSELAPGKHFSGHHSRAATGPSMEVWKMNEPKEELTAAAASCVASTCEFVALGR